MKPVYNAAEYICLERISNMKKTISFIVTTDLVIASAAPLKRQLLENDKSKLF